MAFYFGVAALTTALAMLVEGRRRMHADGGMLSRRRMLDYMCLSALFIILAGLAGLRIEVGNDYGKYVENFHEIWAGTDSAYVVTEIGFNIVGLYIRCQAMKIICSYLRFSGRERRFFS